MTTTIAEVTLSNKAKGKEQTEVVKIRKEWEITGSIGIWQIPFSSPCRGKISSDV